MSNRWRQRRSFQILVAVVLALVGSTGLMVSPAHAAAPTVVSLTFDDGQASQAATLSMLQSRGTVGTYYINSAMVGSSSYYMMWPPIHDIAAAGNEIGGHTLHHANLTTVSATTATTEVCDDSTNLINQGLLAGRLGRLSRGGGRFDRGTDRAGLRLHQRSRGRRHLLQPLSGRGDHAAAGCLPPADAARHHHQHNPCGPAVLCVSR